MTFDPLISAPRIFSREELQEAAERALKLFAETGAGTPVIVYGDQARSGGEVTTELAAWLTAIWDEEERAAQGVVDRYAPDDASIYLEDPWPEEAAYLPYIKPASVLARIAADRKILDAYQYRAERMDEHPVTAAHATGLLIALRCIAESYADRPGFIEEWRP